MLLILILALLLMAVVSGNNLSACVGTMISGKAVRKNTGILIAIVGYLLGLFIESGLIRNALYANIPVIGTTYVAIALVAAIAVFIISNLIKLPQSLSLTLAGAAIGISVAIGYYVKWSFVALMFAVWLVAPIVSILIVLEAMKFTRKIIGRKHVWRTVKRIKVVLIVSSFLMAFVLGANTLGIVYSAIPNTAANQLFVIAAVVLGSFFLSSSTLRRIGSDIIPIRYLNAAVSQMVSSLIVETATIFGIPIAGTEVLTSSIYGAGASYKSRLMSRRTAFSIAYEWVIMLVAGFAIAYVLALIFI